MHTGFRNPVIAAKRLATLDRIGHGRAGVTQSFVDFAGEFPYFRGEVLPRLKEAGLREGAGVLVVPPQKRKQDCSQSQQAEAYLEYGDIAAVEVVRASH